VDVVLGVAMAPTAVRMVLVEGEDAHGATVDHRCFDLTTEDAAASALAGILGTRDSASEGGHRIIATGVVWNDPVAAARLKSVLRAASIDDVILVSELHAAGALAQAIGQAAGYGHTALMFLERDTATLAVVRAADGAVVKVASRSLHVPDAASELQVMVAGLERLPNPPQALFMVGSGVDVAALKTLVALGTTLPVHIPEDAALALARGAALAAVNAPRYDASTVGLAPNDVTVGLAPRDDTSTIAGIITQQAAIGYMAPRGYSAVPDEPFSADPVESLADLTETAADLEPDRDPFLRVGGALLSLFVIGVFALVASLVITIRPAADQRADPDQSAAVSSVQPPVPAAPETIANPLPVVQEAPVLAPPRVAAPPATAAAIVPQAQVPVPVAPVPVAPVPVAPVPVAPAPVAPVPVAPAPVAPAPVVVIPPILPQLLPQLVPQLLPQIALPPVRAVPVPRSPVSTSTTLATPAQTSPPTQAPVPSATPSSTTAQASTSVESTSSATESATTSSSGSAAVSTTPLLPTSPAA
jgi:hypothetical protein